MFSRSLTQQATNDFGIKSQGLGLAIQVREQEVQSETIGGIQNHRPVSLWRCD